MRRGRWREPGLFGLTAMVLNDRLANLTDPALESEVNMLEWLLKHSGHILKIEVHYDVMKTFWCHCLTCDETESFNYFK